MRGRDINLDAIAGKGRTLVIKPMSEGGEAWDFGAMTVFGELRDERDEEKLADLGCSVTGDGRIVVEFPAMELGRYCFVVEASGESGAVERFLNGYVGYQVPEMKDIEVEESPERCLQVYVEGEKRRALWNWVSNAEMVYEDIRDLVESVRPELEEATELLEWAKKLTDSFNEAIRECIKVVNNYLYVGNYNTGHYLKGEDGVTPHIGADGYWYAGENRLSDRPAFGKDGLTPYITSDGFWAIGDVKTRVRAEGRDGLDGTAIRRILIDSVFELPETEERGVYYYVRKGNNEYDVYVWLENAGWSLIGPANDVAALNIATDRVHGMMKFSAGAQTAGAPVGWLAGEDGTAVVPLAGEAVAGTGKVVSIDFSGAGAGIHLDEDGVFRVKAATTFEYGTIKFSTSDIISGGAVIGANADGQAMVPWATLYTGGVIKLGSQYGQGNPVPYIVGIGATQNHELANNYAYGGALQHRKPEGWRGTMTWLDSVMEQHPGYFNDMFYSGIMTSGQFTQGNGSLELLPATTTTLAGVYIAADMGDDAEAHVPQARTIRNWVEGYTWNKAAVYTRSETEDYVARVLAAYASIAWVNDNYYTKAQVDALLKGKVSGFGTEAVHVMSHAEHQALSSTNKNHTYLVFAD